MLNQTNFLSFAILRKVCLITCLPRTLWTYRNLLCYLMKTALNCLFIAKTYSGYQVDWADSISTVERTKQILF